MTLRQCPRCGTADRSADRICPVCGAERRRITLGELLPQVLAKQAVNVEYVTNEAGELLMRSGGLGGWLRPARAAAAG